VNGTETAPSVGQPAHGRAAVGNAVLLRVAGIAKTFGSTVALRDCSIELSAGEVHAVIGENGSGKSTLVKILSGVHLPDDGRLSVGDRVLPGFATPRQAMNAGVATVFQEVLIAGKQSVFDNVWMGTDGLFRSTLTTKVKRDRAGVVLSALLGEAPSLDVRAGTLPLSVRQACVIARALVRDPRILILDEATSALDVQSRDRLFGIIRDLSARGTGVMFISHRMDEVEAIGDRITVLRSGEAVATVPSDRTSPRELVRLMTGAEHLTERSRVAHETRDASRGGVVLRTSQLRLRPTGRPIDVRFGVGELIGLAGLEGHGQDAFLRALRGEPVAGGHVVADVGHSELVIDSPRKAVRGRIAYVPRDRRLESLFPTLSTRENFAVATLGQDTRGGLVRRRLADARLTRYVDRLAIKLGRPEARVTTLSGGNQQKLVMARWLAADPRILLLNDPTRGVDLAAKRDIYALLSQLAAEGVAVVMLSTEVDELIELMDRVLVFREGELFAELPRARLSRAALLSAFFGYEDSEHA
jgi:ABC-type sugar transport system ATPase subunit